MAQPREKPHLRTDILTPEQRSRCMSRIKGRDTKPEILLRSTLWLHGYRYRLRSHLEGKPDIVFVRQRVAVFVDGCFWHRCPQHATRPRTNAAFWREKIDANVCRDAIVNRILERDGWCVLRFWEHEVKDSLHSVLSSVMQTLHTQKNPKARINIVVNPKINIRSIKDGLY
jgi:DNA mismatch endonuclease (patch repair protein)